MHSMHARRRFSARLLQIVVVLAFSLTLLALVYGSGAKTSAASLPAYRYTKTFDTSSNGANAVGYATAIDPSGNVYVAGSFTGTVVFDGPGGSDSRNSGASSFLTKYNANGSYISTKIFDTSVGGSIQAAGVDADSAGNVFVTGFFNGTVVFDGPGGSDSQTSANNSSFLTKYNADGSYGFTRIFDTSSGGASANGAGVTVDGTGNIYVGGGFAGTVVFDGPGGSDNQTSANGSSFLAKYSANGGYVFSKVFDTSTGGGGSASVNGVTVDNAGNVYAVGFFDDTVVFDGPGGSDNQTSANPNSFLTKYNADGSYGFTKILDTSASGAYAAGYGTATDPVGNVYVAGYSSGTVLFDGPGGSDSQTSANGSAFLMKYSANGSYGFTKILDTSASGATAGAYGIATDSAGNAYLTGFFNGTVLFDGPGGSDSLDGGTNSSAFLMKYSANGNYGFARALGSSAADYTIGSGIAVGSGDAYVTGNFQGTVLFDGPGGSDSQTSANGSSFLTSYQIAAFGSSGSSDNSAGSALPNAPDTGFGTPLQPQILRIISITALLSFVLFAAAAGCQKARAR